MKFSVLLTVMCLFLGCSATYRAQVVTRPPLKLERGKGVFISTPKNGSYGVTEYQNSGAMTANAVKAAFSKFSNNVIVSKQCQGSDCLKIVPNDQFEYYVELEILHWEDRATEWSGIPDKIEIKISVYYAKLGTELASSILSASSKWATLGGDHPQDLLPEPINSYVESLY